MTVIAAIIDCGMVVIFLVVSFGWNYSGLELFI